MWLEWETAFLAAIITLNTTSRGCELKGLQWSDVDLFKKALTFRKSKTDAGERIVPLTDVAVSALGRLRRRAENFGPVEPSHYVFAKFSGRRANVFDPTGHVKSWRSAWRTLDQESGITRLPLP